MYLLSSPVIVLAFFGICTYGLPIPTNNENTVPLTVGYTRLNFVPSSPVQIPAAPATTGGIQLPQQPLGYHSNAFLYPSPQNVIVWTPVGGPPPNPATTAIDNEKVQADDDTVSIIKPEEGQGEEMVDGDTLKTSEMVEPPQAEGGEDIQNDDEAVSILPGAEPKPVDGAEAQPAGPQQPQFLIPLINLQPPSNQFAHIGFIPSHSVPFVHLLPPPPPAPQTVQTVPEPEPKADDATKSEKASEDEAQDDDVVVIEPPGSEVEPEASNDDKPEEDAPVDEKVELSDSETQDGSDTLEGSASAAIETGDDSLEKADVEADADVASSNQDEEVRDDQVISAVEVQVIPGEETKQGDYDVRAEIKDKDVNSENEQVEAEAMALNDVVVNDEAEDKGKPNDDDDVEADKKIDDETGGDRFTAGGNEE